MALADSNIAELNQDPQFYQDLQAEFVETDKSALYFDTKFEGDLQSGRTLKVTNAPIPSVNTRTGSEHGTVTYGETGAIEETFTLANSKSVDEIIYDLDGQQAKFDAKKAIATEGLRRLHQSIGRDMFQFAKEKAFNVASVVDLTALATDTLKGDAVAKGLIEAQANFQSNGYDSANGQSCFDPNIYQMLKFSSRTQLSTEQADRRNQTGIYEMLDGKFLDYSPSIFADTTSFDTTAKGDFAAGVRKITVDNAGSGTINKPMINDTIANGGSSFRIVAVKEVTADVEYELMLDRGLISAIADNATVAILGRHTAYNIVTRENAGQMVIPKKPVWEELRPTDKKATVVRTNDVVYDLFIQDNAQMETVILPFKYRTIA